MKVAHIGLDLVPSSGGSVVSIRDFSSVLPSTIISFTQPAKLRTESSAICGTRHIEVSSGLLGRTFAWATKASRRAAWEAISDADLIVCHILLRYHVHWVKAVAKKRNIPYWVVPHGCLDPYVFSYRSFIKRAWFSFFGRPFLENAANVIFATEKEKIKACHIYQGRNTSVIHWPVEPLDCSRREFARRYIRESLELEPDDKILIYVGRLHSMKRPLETIVAFAEARTTGTYLLVVGPDETITQQHCRDLVAGLELSNVILAGPVFGQTKNDYLLASDGFISLSHRENFGYTTAEALSAGLPVILSPGNDLSDELLSHKCGWMLPDDDPETAASAISQFSASTVDDLEAMGERGRAWSLENLSFTKFSEQVIIAANNVIKK